MTDSYGRTIDYIRVSITDRCNLRCAYCMPQTGVDWIPHAQILSFEEIMRVCSLLSGLGVKHVKITGGEPLIRKGVVSLIRSLKAIMPQVTLTSNGVLLRDYLDDMKDAGLDAVNISLDTLNPETFRRITLCDGLDKVLASIDGAISLGIPVKINCVPIRENNESELVSIAGLAREKDVSVRFIELMPVGRGDIFEPIKNDEVLSMLGHAYGPLTPYAGRLGNGPAVYYEARGFLGKLGFISAMSHEFCSCCNRLRLTSDGFMKPCLYSGDGLDIKALLRSGATDKDIKKKIEELVNKKPLRHKFNQPKEEQRDMFKIGG